jgi:predicted nucleic acid-binding protein
MKVIIDTNVIIDILERREPFFADSYRLVQLGLQGVLDALVGAGAVTDAYYIISQSLRRQGISDVSKAKEKIAALKTLVGICDTTAPDIDAALALNMTDFEDAVVAATAKREGADYIVTRNEADFAGSPVLAICPHEFLQRFL